MALPVALLAIIAWATLLVASFIFTAAGIAALAAMAAIGMVACSARCSPRSRSRRPISSGSSPRTTTGPGRSPRSWRRRSSVARSRGPYRRLRQRSGRERIEAVALAGASDGGGRGAAARPTNLLPETSHEWAVSRGVARPLLDQLGASLDAPADHRAGADRPRSRPPRPLHAPRRAAAAPHRIRVQRRQHGPVTLRQRPLRRRHRGYLLTFAAAPGRCSCGAAMPCWRRSGPRPHRRAGRQVGRLGGAVR